MSGHDTSALPILPSTTVAESLPLLVDRTAVDAFRRQYKIEPARIRRMRYALYQLHVAPEQALSHLQEAIHLRGAPVVPAQLIEDCRATRFGAGSFEQVRARNLLGRQN